MRTIYFALAVLVVTASAYADPGSSISTSMANMSGFYKESTETDQHGYRLENDDEQTELLWIDAQVQTDKDGNSQLTYAIHRAGCQDETSEDKLPFKRNVKYGISDFGLPYIIFEDNDRREHNNDHHSERFARRWTTSTYTLRDGGNELNVLRQFKYRAFRAYDYTAFEKSFFKKGKSRNHEVTTHSFRFDRPKVHVEKRRMTSLQDSEDMNFVRISEQEFRAELARTPRVCKQGWWFE